MIFKSLRYNLPVNDNEFDKIYPSHIQNLSEEHWTSVSVARKASEFLASTPQTRILDIGSGVGKFCFIGAATTSASFYGIEQRKEFVNISKNIIRQHKLSNVTIIHSNITDIQFSEYDAFYFFNSFYENLDKQRIIDCSVRSSFIKYKEYRDYMYLQLLKAPAGTRLVTYSGFNSEIPQCYKVKKSDFNNSLKFWIKENSRKTFI